MKAHLTALALLASSLAHAQQPPPPPPPDTSDSGGIPGGNLDLSDVPVPESDRKILPDLTESEISALPVQLSVIPVGPVPPPIIYVDESGMPREKYRDPLEYPPVVYHVATERGSIRVIGAQNQMAPPTSVPRRGEIQLSYERPLDANAAPGAAGKPSLKTIGAIPVPAGATHLVVVLWKDASSKLWTNPKFRVLDVSPSKVKPNEAVVLNASGRDLSIHRGDKPYKIAPGFMGTVALPVNARGQVPMVVAAASGVGWHQLSRTILGPGKDERIFVLAWQAPEGPAQPSGVSLNAVARRLPAAVPFEPGR